MDAVLARLVEDRIILEALRELAAYHAYDRRCGLAVIRLRQLEKRGL